jgi:hypothetical protein
MTQDELDKLAEAARERLRLTSREQCFIGDLEGRPAHYNLSPKQHDWLLKIWRKLQWD